MQITLESKPFAGVETEALVSYVFEESDPVQGRVAEIDHLGGGLLRRLAKSGELTGKMLEFTLLHAPAGLKARSVRNFAMLVREGQATEESAQVIVEGILTADFESDKYKTDKKNDKRIASVSIAGYSDAERQKGEKGVAKGRVIADSQNFARDLINEPSNKLTPSILAQKAEAMAKAAGLSVEILDEKK